MDSISCGFKKFNGFPPPVLELSSASPSTTNKGVLPVLTPPGPRTVIASMPPGSPLAEVTFTPATLPWSSCSGELIIPLLKDSLYSDFTEPVISFLFCVPYPTTTTWVRSALAGFKDTLSVVFPFTVIDWLV